jgi:hypothetical protein
MLEVGRAMTARRLGFAALLTAIAAPASADDSCQAFNGICDEVYLGGGFCAPGTDDNDCANSYVLPMSDSQELTVDHIRYLSGYGLHLARNEIFARHGYRFQAEDLEAFFGRRSWYAPDDEVTLSPLEQANVDFLRMVENGAILVSQQPTVVPDGSAPPPPTAWQATVVHADGTEQAAVVDGMRGRVVDLATTRTYVIRADREDALIYNQVTESPEDALGTVYWWGMFPPILLEPFVQKLGIVPQPLGRETLFGEDVTRVAIDWASDADLETIQGEAWLTDDGIFLKVDIGGEYVECCGGDGMIPYMLQYHLEDLVRGRTDPSLMEPPPFYQWTHPG